MESFGEALRRYREQAGMSQPHLSELANWSQSRISRAENDKAFPPEGVVARLDAILGARGELLARHREAETEQQARTRARRAARDGGSLTDPEGVSESERRQALALAGAIAFGAALPQPAAEIIAEADARTAPTRVLEGDVVEVERTIADLESRDHSAGGIPVRHLALGELRWATALLGGSFLPGLRKRLTIAVAYLSDLAAWTTADAGRYQAARKLFLLGLKAAHDAGDPGVLAHVASGFARLEIQARNPRAALDLVRLARSGADELPQPAVSMLHVVKALALSRMADARECHRLLGRAAEAFRAPTADDPAWIGYFSQAKLLGDTGNALYDLAQITGRRDEALLDLLGRAVDSYPDSRARSKSIAAARLATTLYMLNDRDQANSVGAQAVTLAQGVRSVRLTQDLTALAHAAGRFAKDDEAREITRKVRRLAGPSASP